MCKAKILTIVFLLLLAACQSSEQVIHNKYGDVCIEPLDSFVYSINPDPEKIPGNPEMQIAPNWQIETDLGTNKHYWILTSRKVDENIEIWSSEINFSKENSQSIKNLYVYNTVSKTHKIISAEIDGSDGILVDELFVGPDGSLWAQNDIGMILSTGKKGQYPILSKFNEEKEIFEFDSGTLGIPLVNNQYDDNPLYYAASIIDSNGIFWFVVPRDAIYSYNPNTGEMIKRIDIPNIISFRPVISDNGNIFLIDESNIEANGLIQSSIYINVFQYLTKENVLSQIPIKLAPWPLYSSLLVDHTGKLWLGGVGYRDLDGRVYQLEQASIFIVNYIESGLDHRWMSPNIRMESSDGRIWYSSPNGLAWLDLEEEQWCWVSTSKSNVIEDGNHNLWMIAYGKLYRKPIKPVFEN